MRILVVEDAVDLAEAIIRRFQRAGHSLDHAITGEDAEEFLDLQQYDLMVLDINLPGKDGFSVLKEMRKKKDTTPVLVLTARSEIDDRVSALDVGADDYVVKPFDFRELEARARALLRRKQGYSSSVTVHGNTVFDRSKGMVSVDERTIILPNREFRVLEIFLGNIDRILTKEEIVEQLYGFDDSPGPNAIELYVARLRKKLEGASVSIRTVRGMGYVAELEN
ncbi:MAG: response regulator transcription factor [Rhodospirillales bacterium]|nr:response regulator transcription factor [Rhodospirillales bacterium]